VSAAPAPLAGLVDAAVAGKHEAIRWFTAPSLWIRAVPDDAQPADPLPHLFLLPTAHKPAAPAPLSIGSSEACQLVLPFRFVSKLHAHLRPAGGGWLVEDAGSSNGTVIGGEKLAPGVPRTLAEGERISFGGVEATLEAPDTLWSEVRQRMAALGLGTSTAGEERRRAGRLAVDLPCSVAGAGEALSGRALDLSMVGVRVHTNEAVGNVGQPALVCLDGASGELILNGAIARTSAAEGGVETAIRFLSLPPAVADALAAWMRQLAKGSTAHVAAKFRVRCEQAADLQMTLNSLSLGGLEVSCGRALKVGETIAVAVDGRPATQVVELSGTVATIKEGRDGRYRVGIHFAPLTGDRSRELEALIELALSIRAGQVGSVS
jgi:hypothetical protein